MTGAIVAIAIVLITVGGITGAVVSYFWLQRHRADAVAMAGYRKLAEQAVANQESLHAELSVLTTRLAAIEQLLRSVE
jgi:ABC-type Zn2+ transport system substrate-binding protein/surface adhesin